MLNLQKQQQQNYMLSMAFHQHSMMKQSLHAPLPVLPQPLPPPQPPPPQLPPPLQNDAAANSKGRMLQSAACIGPKTLRPKSECDTNGSVEKAVLGLFSGTSFLRDLKMLVTNPTLIEHVEILETFVEKARASKQKRKRTACVPSIPATSTLFSSNLQQAKPPQQAAPCPFFAPPIDSNSTNNASLVETFRPTSGVPAFTFETSQDVTGLESGDEDLE